MSDPAETPVADDGVLVVRRGPGANCSSIGSAVEMLFLSATVGTAILAAVAAALDPKDDDGDDDPDEPAPPPPPAPEAP
mgnify:CR=1 FL=1